VRRLALIVLLVGLVAGCGGAPNEATPPAETTTENVGEPAPSVEGVTLDGARVSLAELQGRPVFVNVWSSW
jgi:cytochrome oxidase Cu insertion factor (SCO1/SenC/PrrC family)